MPLGPLAALMSAVTWAYASTRYAEVARASGSEHVNLMRALGATALWWAVLLFNRGGDALSQVTLASAGLLAVSSACSYGIGDGVFFSAAAHLGVAPALAIATTYPAWATLYGVLFRGEPFGVLRGVGLALCVLGVSSILQQERQVAAAPAASRGVVLGVVLSVVVSLLWAGNAVFLKLGAERLSTYETNAVRFVCAIVLLLPQWWWRRTRARRERRVLRAPLTPLIVPILADTGLGSLCYVYGIAHSDLAIGATLSSLSPLVALGFGAVHGSEQLTRGRVLTVSMTVAGVVLLVLSGT